MELKVGQKWASNLPGRPSLIIKSISSNVFLMFPVILEDQKGASYYATPDGVLKQVVSPTGNTYRLTMLMKELVTPGPDLSFKERQLRDKKYRENNNKNVIAAYKLKTKKGN